MLDGFNLADEPAPHSPNVLTIQEAARLVAACPKETPLDRRDRMIVLLLYGCGLRTDELRRVQVNDVDRDRRRFTVGSSPYTSSPTSAAAIAIRISGVGRVTVSDRKSIKSTSSVTFASSANSL